MPSIARSVGSMGVPTNVARPIMSFRGFSTNYVAEPRKMMHSSFVEYDYPCGGPVSENRYQECAIPAGSPVGGACSIRDE